jgi:hypothetical protein
MRKGAQVKPRRAVTRRGCGHHLLKQQHMATITKLQRPDGTVYKARIRRHGTQGETSRTFKTRNAAERWARKVEASIEQDDAGLVSVAQKHTLTEAIERYHREILPTLNPSTIPNYTRHLTYWDNALGQLRLSDLTAAKIAACRDELATVPMAGKTPESAPACRTPASVRRYLATLAAVLSACQKQWHQQFPANVHSAHFRSRRSSVIFYFARETLSAIHCSSTINDSKR